MKQGLYNGTLSLAANEPGCNGAYFTDGVTKIVEKRMVHIAERQTN